MERLASAVALLALLALPSTTLAQDASFPTPAEYAERALRAENAPLFQAQEPLRMTLRTRIDWLRNERSDSVEVEGTLTFSEEGSEVVKPVATRARGERRRDKAVCNFPPLRLNFPTGEMKGTVFEGQDKLKLVTPCHDARDTYQNYIFDEYLAYRTLNILTPYSFRVRLVEVTYEDVDQKYEPRTKFGFLIEDEEAMAERNRGVMVEVNQFHPGRANGEYSVLVAMFNYMISNLDWSPVYFHNFKLVRTEDARYLTIPYDFDVSGVVNPRYGVVPPDLPVQRLTQRLFRGFCRAELTYPAAVQRFADTRAEVAALYEGFGALGFEQFTEKDARDALKFYEDFYEVVDDEGDFKREILRHCREMG